MSRFVSPVVLLALAACNQAPFGTELALGPDAPTTSDDLVLELAKEAVDENKNDVVTYTVAWARNGEPVDDLADAFTVPAERTAKGEVWTATVTPWDDKISGESVSAEIAIVNTAPVAEVSVAPIAPDSTEDLVATASGSDVDGDEVTLSYTWFRDGEKTGLTEATVPASETTKGEVWEVRVTADDGETTSEVAAASVSVENVRPVVQSVQLAPAEATTVDAIVASVVADDADGDAITTTFVWSIDGEAIEHAGDTLPAELTAKGDSVTVSVYVNDGFVDSEVVTSEAVAVVNTAPSYVGAQIEPTGLFEDSTASCVPSGWSDVDGDAEQAIISWTVNGSPREGVTLDGSAFSRGDILSCSVVPFDGEAEGDAVVAASVEIGNTAPVLSGVSIDIASPKEGDTLSAVLGSTVDIDGDAVSYAYSWEVNGSVVSTASTLGSESFAKGDSIVVKVTPSDDADAGGQVVSAAVTVVNTAPVLNSIATTPSADLKTDSVIEVSYVAEDADGDSITATYNWTVDGVFAGSGSSLDGASAFERGEVVQVSVVVSDGTESSARLTSAAMTVGNSVPSVDSASISPSVLSESTTASCVGAGWSDADGDSESYDVSWSVNGTTVATTATLDPSFFGKGDSVVCELTPNDRELGGVGTAVSSAAVVIVNSKPELASVSLDTLAPLTDDVVTATASGVDDADGDTVTLSYSWSVNGTEVYVDTTTALTSTLDGATMFGKGDTIAVVVTPHDGSESGASQASSVATVGNSAPSIDSASMSPGVLYTTTTASASYSASDADGDGLSGTVTWYVDGGEVATGTSLDASYFSKGEAVHFSLTVTDGTDSDTFTSAAVTVSNSAPTAASAVIDPAAPLFDEDFQCTVPTAATDADGDSITYTVTWTLDGSPWTGSTYTTTLAGDSIDAVDTTVGDVWACTVTANDGTVDGPSVTSTAVTVANCGNPSGGPLTFNNGAGTGMLYCYESTDTIDQRAEKACESHFGEGNCCIIPGGYSGLQWGECGMGGGAGTIHWHPDAHPSGHCAPYYTVGDVVAPGWCGSITGRFL